MADRRKHARIPRPVIIRQITRMPSNLVFMLSMAVPVQAMHFCYHLDNEIESQVTNIAQYFSVNF
jgi:hypothetical protein